MTGVELRGGGMTPTEVFATCLPDRTERKTAEGPGTEAGALVGSMTVGGRGKGEGR